MGKYQIIKVAMHKHEYGFWGHNGYILPIYYSCIFTISLIRFLRQTRDLLIMLPRGGQLLIGREAGEIEGHFFLSEKSPALKNTAIHQERNAKAQGSPKGFYLWLHRDFTILLHCCRRTDESTFTTSMSCSPNIDFRGACPTTGTSLCRAVSWFLFRFLTEMQQNSTPNLLGWLMQIRNLTAQTGRMRRRHRPDQESSSQRL